MQLFLLWHRRTAFTTSENDSLATLRNRELALQFCGSSEERGDAWSDVIVHTISIEESHLLLNGTKDTRIARM